jgi:hypothetical protein
MCPAVLDQQWESIFQDFDVQCWNPVCNPVLSCANQQYQRHSTQ